MSEQPSLLDSFRHIIENAHSLEVCWNSLAIDLSESDLDTLEQLIARIRAHRTNFLAMIERFS